MHSTERRFEVARIVLVALFVVAAVAGATGTTTTKTVHPATRSTSQATKTYSGTSDKGDFEQALDVAIQSAMESRKNVSDAMIEWKLKDVSGVRGGIGGFHKLTVTIEAKPR